MLKSLKQAPLFDLQSLPGGKWTLIGAMAAFMVTVGYLFVRRGGEIVQTTGLYRSGPGWRSGVVLRRDVRKVGPMWSSDDDGYMSNHGHFIPISTEGAKLLGDRMGVDWNRVPLDQFRRGIEVEQEHWQTVDGDLEKIADIAIAHIQGRRGLDPDDRGLRDYYDRLDAMEEQAEREG